MFPQIKKSTFKYILIIFYLVMMVLPKHTYANRERDSLVQVLKNELNNKAKYDREKEATIELLKTTLIKIPDDNLTERYQLKSALLNEYISYQRDSALIVSHQLLAIAEELADQRMINAVRLRMGTILISSGMFKEASDCISLIDVKLEQQDHKFEYYHLLTWLNWALQTSIGDQVYAPQYMLKEQLYRDSAVLYANTAQHDLELIGMFSEDLKINSDRVYQLNLDFLSNYFQTNPQRAARLAYMYSDLYEDERKLNFLLLASIFDVRNSTKETPAIIKVGEHLFKEGDVDPAFFFLKQAMDNANFFGSKLHKIEITSILPQVTLQKMLQTERKIMFIVIISLFLIGVLAWVIYSRTKLESLNQKISCQNSKLQETLQALEKSQRENSWIMKVLAHDLRGTIAGSMTVNSILNQNNNLSSEEKMMLKLLDTANHDALETISDLLNLNTDQYVLNKNLIQLDQLITDTAKLFRYKAEEKGQQLISRVDSVCIPLNREKIRRVLYNLISNAIKFSPIDSEITLELLDYSNQAVRIKIYDQGIGIPEELRETIFDIDPMNRREGTSGEQSFGLGLYICKKIVLEHAGAIWIENNTGLGTVFVIELPK